MELFCQKLQRALKGQKLQQDFEHLEFPLGSKMACDRMASSSSSLKKQTNSSSKGASSGGSVILLLVVLWHLLPPAVSVNFLLIRNISTGRYVEFFIKKIGSKRKNIQWNWNMGVVETIFWSVTRKLVRIMYLTSYHTETGKNTEIFTYGNIQIQKHIRIMRP